MTHLFYDRLSNQEWPRAGVRFAEASVASRSEADSSARRAIFSYFGFSLQNTTLLKKLIPSSIPGWTHSTWIRFQQFADQKIRKINHAFFVADQFDPHRVADECFAHKPLASAPFDLPVASHTAHDQATGIAQQHIPLWRTFRTINLPWRPLPQPFVGSNLIVSLYPTVRPPLLSSQVTRSRSRRLGLQYSMHLFVRPVLLRMPRGREFDANPQSRPPSAQSRKPRRPSRSKGGTIVHADDLGISLLPKQTQKNSPDWSPALIFQQAYAQQISTELIPHSQRFHSLAILSPEPTFEVHRPHVVAPRRHRQCFAAQLRAAPRSPAARAIQFQPLEPLANRPRTGGLLPRIFSAQSGCKLPAAPTPMSSAQAANPLQPFWGSSLRRTLGTTGSLAQPARSLPLESGLPFVAALATQSEQPAQLRHALLGLQSQLCKLQPPGQSRELFQRHAREKGEK
jgi:hypothetical protein